MTEPICPSYGRHPNGASAQRCFRPAGHEGFHSNLTSWTPEEAIGAADEADPQQRTCECGRVYANRELMLLHQQRQAEIREAMGDDYLGHRTGGPGVIEQPAWLEGKFE